MKFKDIKKNFFDDYLKYWLIFFLVLFLNFLFNIKSHYIKTDKITNGIDNSMYVTSAVIVNNKHLLANKTLIDNACLGPLSGLQGELFAISDYVIYKIVRETSNAILDLSLLRLYNNQENFKYPAVLQLEPYEYKKKKLIIPVPLNKPYLFQFKSVDLFDKKFNNFLIKIKNIRNKNDFIGFPVFNKNYVLKGIIKNVEDDEEFLEKKDKVLSKTGIEKRFLVINIDQIKEFLNVNNVKYSAINSVINLNNDVYRPKNSVVNIFCIKTY